MDKHCFFSIVMPVYGVELHLKKAVDSVCAQTFGDFEIILVDDCSPDKSGEIADALAEKDERIKVIHLPENSGASVARNVGMEAAQGRYIFFMDSDDIVDNYLLAEVHKAAQKYSPKMIVWGLTEEYYNENNELSYSNTIDYPEKICGNKDETRREIINLESKTLLGYLWNKVYDLEYLRNIGITIKKMSLNEDIIFNVEFIRDIDSMIVLPITPYHYYKRIDNSLTNRFVPDYFELHRLRVESLTELHDYWGITNNDNQTVLANIYSRYIFSALQRNCDERSGMNGKARRLWVDSIFNDELFIRLEPFMKNAGGKMKILNTFLTSHNAFMCLFIGKFIYLVKDKYPILFSKLKRTK